MKTQLTQQLLRQFTYNALHISTRPPLLSLSPQCPRVLLRRGSAPALAYCPPKRGLFSFMGQSREPPPATKYEPGYEKLVELEEKTRMGVRPPPVTEVKASFLEFVRHKVRQRWPEDNQLRNLVAAYNYIQSEVGKGELEAELSISELNNVLELLARTTSEKKPQSIIEFARRLFEQARAKRQASSDGSVMTEEEIKTFQSLTRSYLAILALEGHAVEACELAQRYWREGTLDLSDRSALVLARGLLLEGRDEGVLELIKDMEQQGLPLNTKVHKSIVRSYVTDRKDIEQAKRWLRYPTPDGKPLDIGVMCETLDLCIERDDFEFGDEVLRKIMEASGDGDSKSALEVTLRYAAAKGKGVDEVGRMMDVLVRKSPNAKPDMQTIHGLVMLSMKKFNDPFTAERYITMGLKRGFEPTSQTYLLQMEYRLQNKDLNGALTAFDGLRGARIDLKRSKPLNHLIIALCESKNPDHELIMSVVDFLNAPHLRLFPPAVFALAHLHLKRREIDDFKDLLNTYAQSFGSQDRGSLSKIVLDYVLDPKVDTAVAWEIWLLIRKACPEIPVETRTTVMKSFFGRGRSDMGTHVFGQMRQSYIREQRPGIDTYAACLQGIGRLSDGRNLKTVHSMFKLDMEVDLCTKLYNALMIGYTGCGDPERALEMWEEVANSQEGPTYASLLIALRACERASYGATKAREIFDRIKNNEVEITKELYAAYVGALAGHGLVSECKRLIDNAPKEGFPVDALLLGTLWNASPGELQRDEVNDWSRESFPDAYKDLLKIGKKEIRRPFWPDEPPGWCFELEDEENLVGEIFWDIGHLGRDVDP